MKNFILLNSEADEYLKDLQKIDNHYFGHFLLLIFIVLIAALLIYTVVRILRNKIKR